jgi:sec-independent protein translocase protein TatC
MTLMAGFWKHMEALRSCIFRIAIAVGAITLFSFIFDIRTVQLFGVAVPLPYPDIYMTVSTRVFLQIKHDLLPPTVKLVSLTPWAAMMIQFQISLAMGIILGMPVIVYEVGRFLGPALKRRERRLILRMVVPATALFVLGVLFAYLLIIPFSISFLYDFAFAMGIEQYFSVEDFFSFVMMFMLAFGVVFELPVIMVGLSSTGLVSPDFWKEHWRWAVLLTLVFAAVITPDGTGITMFLVAVPMLVLYLTGYVISKSQNRLRAVGLLLAAVGLAAFLLAGPLALLGLLPGGPDIVSFGLHLRLASAAGIASFVIGLLLVAASIGGESGGGETAKP